MAARAPLVRLQGGGRLPDARPRRRHARRRAAGRRARSRRGALPHRHARDLPAPARRAPGRRRLDRGAPRRRRRPDGLRRVRRPRGGPGPPAPVGRNGDREGREGDRRVPLGRAVRPPAARRGRARDGRRAVQQLGRVRRRARAQALPPPRGRRQPRARDAALPHAARLPEHRRARRLDRLRGRADGRDARRRAAVRPGWPRRLGARARRARKRPGRLRRPHGGARRRDRRHAQRARLRRLGAGLRAGGAQPGVDLAHHRDDRRADRARLRRPARGRPGARADCSPRRGGPRPPLAALAHRCRRPADPPSRRPPPRPDAAGAGPLDRARLRGRAGAPAARAPPEALAAARRRGHAALVRLRRVGRRAPARHRRARGLGGACARSVPQRVLRGCGPVPAPARRGQRADAPDHLRAREGGLRAALRAQQPPRLGADPGGRDRAPAGGAAAVTVQGDIEAIVRRDLAEPHRILGAHPENGGVVIRTFRPDASKVVARPEGSDPVELELRHPGGVFEGKVPGAELPLRYELEVAYESGTFTMRDPYAFLPTLGEIDLYLAGEGRPEELYEKLGAHVREIDGVHGVAFAVWAPSARSVSVVGDFNSWDGRLHPMRSLGSAGIWELFVPDVQEGSRYKYEIRAQDGSLLLRADPYAFAAEVPPQTASVIHRPRHEWRDREGMTEHRVDGPPLRKPISIYEVHLGSWRRNPLEGNRSLTYLELADELADYVTELGFTHVELLPVMAHPFSGSWGYQVTSYFAPTPVFGSPDDLREFVDRLHQRGIGVILDWVPAHFPRDEFALARFDGTALYEHADPRRGSHPDWGTLVFNFGRHEVRNFLLSSALFWCREYHADGIRVDAVASMLYLDYSREEGQWIPNEFGGNEDLDAVAFLKELNETLHAREP